MDDSNERSPAQALETALKLVTEAMDLLDAHGASPLGAAHLAMAREAIEEDFRQVR